MKFEFDFDDSRMIFYKYYSGVVSFKEVESSWVYLIENSFIPEHVKGILLDYRQAHIPFPIDEAYHISRFFEGNDNVFKNKKIAFVTATPEQIIMPLLVGEYKLNFQSRPFSTLEAAEKWLVD